MNIEKALAKAGADYPYEEVRHLCVSIASFLAEIDSSSSDVAAYLEQRLGTLLLIARRCGGIEAFAKAMADNRKPRGFEPPEYRR